jgi:hypothetical protein
VLDKKSFPFRHFTESNLLVQFCRRQIHAAFNWLPFNCRTNLLLMLYCHMSGNYKIICLQSGFEGVGASVVGRSEHSNESSGSIKDVKCLDC